MAAHHIGRPHVEALVLHVAAGEIAAEQIPRQLVELEAVERPLPGHPPQRLEGLPGGVVLHDRDVCRHLQNAATGKLAYLGADVIVVLGAPVDGRIHHVPVVVHLAIAQVFEVVDLALDHAVDDAVERREMTDVVLHRRHGVDAGRFRHAPCQAEQQAQLGAVADAGLMVGQRMGRGAEIDLAGELDVVEGEDVVPRNPDLVADDDAVALVETVGERVVQFADGVALERLARPQAQARRVRRDDAGDRLLLVALGQGLDIADPDVIAEGGTGREHLDAADDHAVVSLRGNGERRRRGGFGRAAGEALVLAAGRRRHRMREKEVLAFAPLVIGEQVGGEGSAPAVEHLRLHGGARDVATDEVRRAPHHAVGEVGDGLGRARPAFQVLARAGAQVVHGVALAALLEAQQVAVAGLEPGVEHLRVGARRVAKAGMGGDVVDLLAADIDDAAVTQRFQVSLAGAYHR